MYRIVSRILQDRKVAGYVVLNLETREQLRLRLEEVKELASKDSIINAYVDKKGNLRGKDMDLRSLPTARQVVRGTGNKYGLIVLDNIEIKETDIDSDLLDAPYKACPTACYIVGCDLTLTCGNKQSLENLYVLLNDSKYNGIVQAYKDKLETVGYVLRMRLLTYKPDEIFKLIGEFKNYMKVSVRVPNCLDFDRRGVVHINLRRPSQVRMTDLEDSQCVLLAGLARSFKENVMSGR